ncbi:MAG: alpha/beta fold hydrolase [Acidimicrobiia bacterium]
MTSAADDEAARRPQAATPTMAAPGVQEDGRVPAATIHAAVDGQGPRIVLVHGFAQDKDCWGPLGPALATDHETLRVDAPGHGRSSALATGLVDGAGLIADRGGPAVYLGYSMGGRYVLHVAVHRPEVVRGLVLIGATGGIDDPDRRAERRAADEHWAALLECDGLEVFLDAWTALPLFAGLGPESQFRQARRSNTVTGLASSLRRAGTGAQEPLWGRLGTIGAAGVPALVVAGADDLKFAAEARRLVAAIGPTATLELVQGAGHAAHLERPDAVSSLVRDWLSGRGSSCVPRPAQDGM